MSKSSSPIRRNQSKRVLRAAILSTPAVAAALSFASPASAVDLYWDINGATAGGAAGTTATGTWDTSTANWSTDPAGAAATQAWTGTSETAVFAAGTGVTGTYSVTVSGTQTTDGLRFEDGVVTLTGGNVNLNTNGINLARNAASTQVINSVVSGTNGLALSRTGSTGAVALTLGGNNTYTGTTTILGTGTSTTILSLTLNHNNAIGGAGGSLVFSGGTLSDANFVALPGNRIIASSIEVKAGGQNGVANGQLRNTGGVNTWSGNILVNGVTNNLGTGLASIGASAGTLVITGLISNLATAGNNTSGVVWAKTGAGTVILRGTTANTNIGFNRIFHGITELQADGALGAATVQGAFDRSTIMTTQSSSTPTIAFRAPPSTSGFLYSTQEVITTTGLAGQLGLGMGANAMIDNFGGTNTFAGNLRLGGPLVTGSIRASLGAVTGSTLELSGNLYASAAGAGTAAPAPIDARTITKIGGGTVMITGNNDTVDGVTSGDADQYRLHGTFIVDAGTLALAGANGALAGSSNGPMNFQVNLGGTLALDNTTGVNTNRIGGAASITLSAGEVKLIGNDTASVNQAGGAIAVESYSTITVQQPPNTNGATTTFSLGTLSRTNRGTALLRGIDNSTAFATLGGTLKGAGGISGTTSMSILTEVVGDASSTGDGTDFVTLPGSNPGPARVLTASEYTPLVNANTTLVNSTVTANTAITADTTVNSMKLTGGVTPTTVTISPGQQLLVSSGGILGVGASGTSSVITGGKLAFEVTHTATDEFTGETSLVVDSSNEGIITVPLGASLDISSVIAGADGLTKSGRGTLKITGANTYGQGTGGQTTINAGVLEFNTDSNLGAASAPIVINGGTLRPLATSTSARNVTLGSRAANTIDTGSGADFTITGIVSGLALTKEGPGVLTLTNTGNTYTGGTIIKDGTMFLDATNPTQPTYGTGGITLAGGLIRTNTSMTLDKSLASTSTNTTGGFYIASGATLQYGSGVSSAVGMSGGGNYAINGGGTLRLSNNTGAAMTYTGRLIVNDASTLVFHSNDGTNTIAGIGGTPVSTAEWVVLNAGSRLRFEVTSNAGTGFSGGTRGITIGPGGGIIDIAGTNIVINTAGMYGATGQTMTKDGTGLYSMRVSTGNFNGKWNILQGTLEFGAPTNNAASMGTGSGADFITIQDGARMRTTTTATVGTMAANQGITLAGTNHTISVASGTTFTIPGDITAGTGKTLTKNEAGHLRIKNYRGDVLNHDAGNLSVLQHATPFDNSRAATTSKMNDLNGLTARKIDITNNILIIKDPSYTTPVATGDPQNDPWIYDGVHGLVQAGRNPDTGAWDGTSGIVTSMTDATTSALTSLATASGAELGLGAGQSMSFGGQTIDDTDTVVMYTWGGDADLNGDLNGDDYFAIDSNIGNSGDGNTFGYSKGDFDYNGLINGDDYFVIDSNINLQNSSGGDEGLIYWVRDPERGGGVGGLAAVPEPGSIGIVSLGALTLLGRRARRKN